MCFLGPRADTERLYRAADIFVFPTAYEAFPLVALEAAASALPLITTKVNGIEELLVDGEAGVLVERDPEAVGRALATLALDPERRRAMGATARSRSERYTWDAVVGRVLAAYEEVAGRTAEASRR